MHGTVPPSAFAPLDDAERGHGASAGDDDVLDVMPCPEHDPPRRAFWHHTHGEPSVVWLYRTTDAAIVAAAARYDGTAPDGTPQKDVLPWCHGRRRWTDRTGKSRDRTGWHCKAPPAPRSLYGLDRLAARPDAPVLVTEGEKAADAAAIIFPEAACITSQGGSKAPGKADWTPLQGRRVTIWPDHDAPGAAYAATVADLAKQAGADAVRIVEPPRDWPAKWDLADALPEGVTLARLRELMDDAQDGAAPEWPHGFKMTLTGLFFFSEPSEKNQEPPPVFVAAPFRVLGETRSDVGEAWGVVSVLARP